MLAAVRSLITDNALTLQDLFSKQVDKEEGEEEILDLDVDEAWTEDITEAGRHFYDNFVPPVPEEDIEDTPVDIEEESEDILELPESPKQALTQKQIQEFLAATDSGNEDSGSDYSESPQKRKRGRPRKHDQKPKIIILTEVKEKRGRGIGRAFFGNLSDVFRETTKEASSYSN
jgi:hypothetical protein